MEVVGKTLEEKLQDIRAEWTEIIKTLSERMKSITEIQTLLNEIYIKRQECVEYTSTLLVAMGHLNRQYKKEYSQKYQNYKINSQLRYSSDSAINTQIDVELEDYNSKIDLMKVHIEAMRETLKTIDNLIYGVSQRIKIYEMLNGLK